MLTSADIDLVRRDREVRGLELLLDGEAFAAALQPLVPDVHLTAAEPSYVRYKPGVNCLVAYRLLVGGIEVMAYASAYRRGDSDKLLKSLECRTTGSPVGPGRVALKHMGVVVSFFPNDRRLKALQRLSGETNREQLLRKVLPGLPDPASATLRMVRYKPERRYVARLEREGDALAVLKLYDGSAFQAAHLGARAFEGGKILLVPRCLGCSKRHRMLAFAWLPGHPLNELIASSPDATESLAMAGASLAALHRQQPQGLTRHPPAGILKALRAAADGIVSPPLAARARRLADSVATHLRDCKNAHNVLVPIHGDFNAEQVLIDGDTAALIDFDRSRWSDSSVDLGNFIAHLECSRVYGEPTPLDVETLKEALLAGYRATGLEPPPDRVILHTTAGLLQLAPHPFRIRQPDWPEKTEALLDRAEAILEKTPALHVSVTRRTSPAHCPARDVPVVDPYGVAVDPEMPFLRKALDPERVQHHFERGLVDLADAEGGIDLGSIHVRRYKAGRRCLIEYELNAGRPGEPKGRLLLLGKARARGLDLQTYRLQQVLWKGDFGEHSGDGISVPEPVGILPAFNMCLQRRVPGVPATELLEGPGGDALAARIAAAACKLHRTCLPSPLRRHTMNDELIILHERLSRVAAQHPEWNYRIVRLLEACDRLADATPEPNFTLIHRDFYPDNIMVDGERLYLVDLDLHCEGDPALDGGNFIAHITEQSLRLLGNPTAMRDREVAFEEAFVACAGETARPALRAYTMLTLARHISISTQIAARIPFSEALMDLCEQRLGLVTRPLSCCRTYGAASIEPDLESI